MMQLPKYVWLNAMLNQSAHIAPSYFRDTKSRRCSPVDRAEHRGDDSGTSASTNHGSQARTIGQDDGRHGTQRLLPRANEIGGAGDKAICVCLTRGREVVHLIIQQDACIGKPFNVLSFLITRLPLAQGYAQFASNPFQATFTGQQQLLGTIFAIMI